ncbi:abortive infection family protein [Crocosphaera sp. XPORK-15E]|uniref:abortive infection family protein n=1 Tax=Crocosphaera sp. XPORK-15E TaxID=3110247 RepID=UPI002B1F8359|nr:abortive infection family protein [Crocosphaera sp. XPORK-15E]MEA5532407.1 abortive infection family protein [Crocosphaera sp. XPORK-15E]
MAGLTSTEIRKVVNRYIGVSGGYLGDFSYRTHADFYPEYCELDIDPNQYEGTTRERFIAILSGALPQAQAKIVHGVLARFQLNAPSCPETRTEELYVELLEIAKRLEGSSPVVSPDLKINSAIVERTIRDVEALIQTSDAVSGVDRIHTTLHGYLRAACKVENIVYCKDDSMTKLFKLLRQHHPALQDLGPRSQDIERILKSSASIMDVLNPIRNNASVAHPNEDLLNKEEAMLVINIVRSLLHYLDAKFVVEQQQPNNAVGADF